MGGLYGMHCTSASGLADRYNMPNIDITNFLAWLHTALHCLS